MKTTYLLSAIAVMAIVTYAIRATPIILFRKKIRNKWIQSFLFYVPYVVLSAMTFPAVFYSTDSILASVAGCAVALILAYTKRGLLTVAVGAALTAFLFQIF